jgi:DNA invertase Pin-like site-specific DNA recombinase
VRRAGIYLRTGTTDQNAETQLRELETVAARSEWEIVEVYRDAGVSGGKGRDKRPAFNRLIKDATTRKINMIAAWSVDRLGRSLQDLVALLTELQALECDLYLHQQTLDTSTPAGRAMFQMCRAFAEFERGILRERVHSGLTRAKVKEPKMRHRPVKLSDEVRIRELRGEGMSILKIGRTLRIGTSVVQRVSLGKSKGTRYTRGSEWERVGRPRDEQADDGARGLRRFSVGLPRSTLPARNHSCVERPDLLPTSQKQRSITRRACYRG